MVVSEGPYKQRRKSVDSFAGLLAQYRARVYETHFLDTPNLTNSINKAISEPINDTKPAILVVEDDSDEWFLTRWALLQQFTNANICWVAEANAVIPYLETCRQNESDLPKIILVDLYLPNIQQGLSLLQKLKSNPIYKAVPTFALSRSNSTEDINQVFSHSADGYLVKPTSYQDWLGELCVLKQYWNE